MKARVLVLDDERRMVEILAMVLSREGYEVHSFVDPALALAALGGGGFDLLLTDLKMPGLDGLSMLQRTRQLDPALPVILMTAYASVPTAVRAMREGAFDYLQKPFDNEELKALVRRALDLTKLTRENRYLRAELRSRYALDGEHVIAESPALREVFAIVRRAAASRATVLLTGESGTGKELVARALHYYSDRVGGPFVAVNCKALAESLIESELFGHERGAFTGANSSRTGLFERAHQGTLFLDEIGEVSPNFQAKLLRVLQEREVQRVGSDAQRPIDVRLVAATNRDLQDEVAAGRFREDLYFRLSVIPVHLPPLRERRADILPLAQHFLRRYSAELSRRLSGFAPEVEQYFLGHSWPGNVRELENTIERGVVMAGGELVGLSDLLLRPPATARSAESEAEGEPAPGADLTLQALLERATRDHLRSVLSAARGVRSDAARLLGVDRTTLYRLMRKYRLEEGTD
ncbi:MAG TPA: sigma-54 dependent transcriptional regulator [Pseudomonadota bacterium]|nr:sigma-54 dependent transcriptional regulator [Pseudomonadota bacterium]